MPIFLIWVSSVQNVCIRSMSKPPELLENQERVEWVEWGIVGRGFRLKTLQIRGSNDTLPNATTEWGAIHPRVCDGMP